MKRIFILTLAAMAVSLSASAQDQMDALTYGTNDLTGTARSVAMGGAFGALGGDISGIVINPAGIGVYKTSEIVTTLNFANKKYESELNAGKQSENKFKFSFDNLAFVGAFPINSDVAPFINFGFTYNRLKNFNRNYTMWGNNQTNSLTDEMSYIANNNSNYNFGNNNFGLPYEVWLPVFGYNSFLINQNTNGEYQSFLGRDDKVNNELQVKERGSIDSYDFSVGTTFSDLISVGATLSVTDMDYRVSTYYGETVDRDNYFDLENMFETEGTGIQVKAGVILKPINELRIGVSYHSPTWYNMTNYFSGRTYDHIPDFAVPTDYKPGWVDSYEEVGVAVRDYKYKTPDKWTFSLAGIIGQTAIISADYELTNYSNMTFKPDHGSNGMYDEQNDYIGHDFRNSSTIRVGAEIRITPQFSGRVGYSWVQTPVKDSFKKGSENKDYDKMPARAGSIPNYLIEGDKNYFTYGLGYKFTPNFYADIAFVMKNQKSDLYAYRGADKAKLKDNLFSGLLTFGYKF